MTAQLSDSTVLLTGATGGIGHAIAQALHSRGARLIVTGRRPERLAALRSELGQEVEAIAADLTARDQVAALGAREDIDVLVANAALPGSGLLTTFTADEVDRALDVNLRAPMQLALALLPRMLARGSGHLVFVSSLAGKVVGSRGSVYGATKFGLRGFGYALSEELRETGVGATTVFPGFIRDAGLFADSGARLPRGVGTRSPDQVAAAVIRGIEMGRAEIDVAPLSFRLGARAFGLAPGLVSAVQRQLGYERVAARLEQGQRDKR